MLSHFVLDNGVSVVSFSLPHLKAAHLRLRVKGGSVCDPDGKHGLAHFMEHMLLQGTPTWPTAGRLMRYIQDLAGSFQATTYSSSVQFRLSLPLHYLDQALRIGSEVFFSSLFPLPAFERERQSVLEEIRQRMGNDWYRKAEFFSKVRFKKNHPLTYDGGGVVGEVETIQKNDVVDYWKNFFVPQNTYVTLVGNLAGVDLKEAVTRHFGKIISESKFMGYPEMSSSDFSRGQVVIRHDTELKTNSLDLSFPSLSQKDKIEQRVSQHLACAILGGLSTSRLLQVLRFEKGLVYSVACSSVKSIDLGYIDIYTDVVSEKLEEVTEIIVKELVKFIDEGPTKGELDRAKRFILDQSLMSFDDPNEIADWIEGEILWEEKIRLLEDYKKLYQKVTVEDLKRVMREKCDLSKFNLVIQGPHKDNKTTRTKLEGITDMLH